MKQILASDAVKEAVAEAVKTNTAELEQKHEESVKEMVVEYLQSDEFAEKFQVEESEEDEDLDEAKCAECGAAVGKGSKFCPSCGLRVLPAQKEQTQDEKDAAIAEMKAEMEKKDEALAELKKRLDERDEADKKREDRAKVESAIDEVLEGKPKVITEAVREDLPDAETLDAETVKELVEAKVARFEKLAKATGGTITEAGEGKSMPNDDDKKKDDDINESKGKDVEILDRL
jgi:hypothetical protein